MPSKNFLVDVDVRGSLLIGVIPNNIGSFLTISSNDGKTVSKRSLDEVRQDLALVSDTITNGITAIAPSQNVVFSALLKKANIESPIFTGTVGGITKAMVGLGLIDNTTDASKNVFSATKLTVPVLINGISFNGLTNITVADATKEIAFSKNTAFNKSFGSTIGTVAQGDDYRIDNGQTAYGWGNHAGNYLSLNGGIISGNIVPNLDNTHSLGSPTKMWKDVYIGPGSLYINGKKVIEDVSNTMNITTSIDQNLSVKTSGTGILQISALGSGNIELNAISGLIQLKGSVMFQANKLIRSSDGSALLFDDDIQFSSGTGISGALRVSGATTSLSFIVPNGLSSQFLKANGSVDNNTYSTTSHTHAFSSLTSLPSTLIGYGIVDALPLSGGTITGDIVVGTNDRNRGMFGTYDSTKTQHIWSIGTSFRNSATGVDFGNLFGLAYKHTNNITGGSMAGGHQMVWTANGVPRSAIGEGGIWSAGSLSVASGIFGSNLSFPVTINDSGIIFNNRQQGAVSYPSSKKGFNWEISSDGASMAAYELGGDMLEYEFLISDNKASNDRYVWKLNEWQGIYTGIEAMKLVPGSSLFNSQTLLQYGNILLNAPALATRLLSNINTSLNASHTTYIRNNSSFTNPDLGGSTISLTANVSNFTGVNHTGYVIKIKDAVSTPNTFCWSAGGQQGNNVNTPALWHGNDIPLSTSPITLSNGVTITFNAVTGGIANETIGFAVLPKSDIRAQDGTASSPVYTFINSTSTGLYRPSGSNGVGITVSGTERGRFTTIGLDVTGIITATNGNSTNWNDAFGWGNHAGLYSLLNHTHSFSELSSKPTTLSGYGITDAIPLAQKGAPSGVATLDGSGKLLASQLPAISISDTFVVANQSAMLVLVAETGDVAVRTDQNKSYILKGTNPTVLADWQELLTPTSAVTTVFGRSGAIVALTNDYNADQILETASSVFQTPIQRANNDATSSIQTQLNSKQASGSYETAFTKNTAFNKNFGSIVGTVTEGNDSRVNNGQTAFNSLVNYLPLAGGTLSGDLIISKTAPKIRLYNNGGASGYPSLEWDTVSNQGIALTFNEFDGELPVAGYGMIFGPSSTNNQFPTTGTLSLSVLGEIYAGGKDKAGLKKVWHAGNLIAGTGSTNYTAGNDSRVNNGQTAFGWGNHSGIYSLLNHTHSFSELTSKPTTLSGYGITDALVSRYTFEPGNSAGIRRWVRLVTLDGVSLSSGASIDFILAGTGDFGSAQRGNTHVIAGQRSAGGVSIKVYSLNTENTEDPVEIHYVIKSDFVFEIWAYLSDYNYTHQLTVLQSYGTVINTDSITTTAPDGAVLVPRIDIRHTTNFTAGTGSTNYAVGNDSRINNGQTAFTSLGNYLPLTGGTLSGPLTVNATSIKIVDTLTLGLMSEVGGQLINYGTNFSQLGNRDATKAGGFFRIDTRVGYESQFFNVKFAPANSSEQTIFSLSTTGNLSTNGSITAPTFIGNGITGAVGSNSTQLSTNQFVTRGITNARSFNNITGGGTLSVSGSNEVKWTARFIIIGNGSGVDFSTSGYFDIIPPPTSTIITGVGRSDVTVTTNGITLGSWESLYYILPIGSNQVTINANFRVVSYNSAGVIPDNWILLCVNNPDIGTFNFLKGIVLKVNESYNTAVRSHMATGTGLNVLSTSPTLSGLLTTQQVLIGSGVFLANSYLRIGASVNAHIQGNVNNTNAGTLASSDFVATANNGTDTTNFINMGINSSGNTDATWTMAGANDAYLFNNGGHLTIGTSTLAKDIKFFTAGTMAANEKARIFGATGNFSLGNTTDGGFKLDVTGTARVSGVVTLITPVVDTNTTQAATTAFVLGQASSLNPLINGAVAIGTSLRYARADHIHPIDTSRQTALNGTGFVKIVGTTISYDNSTYLTGTKVDSFNTRTGVVTLSSLDVTTALTFTPYNATNPSSYTSNIGTVTSIGGTGTVNGLTLSGVVSVSGNLILGGTLSNIDNSALINSDITIGTTIIPLGSTQTTLLGLVSVTSTTFVGALSGNASTATNIVWSGVTSTPTTLSGYGISDAISLIEKGAANGVATLDGSGKLLASQIPAITISDTFVVANQTAMLAVVAETGDVAVRTDQNKSYILKGTNPTVLADWQELLTPTSAVTTVFGRSGAVSAASNDYNAGQILETTSRVFQTPTQRANNDATSSIQTQLNSKQATLINPITGTGTANYLPKFTGTSTQGNSQIFDNGTNVGFGTATPMYKVDVNGGVINISNGFSEPSSEAGYRLKFADNGGINNDSGIGLSGSLGSESLWINKGSANGNIRFMFGTLGEKVTFTSTGFSGFGTTTPAETIHVEGGVRIKNAWLQSIDNNSLASGIQVVATVEVGTYRAAFFDYVAISGTNVRAGTIMATWYLTTVEFVDTSTNDIGNTSGLILQAVISGSNVVLQSVTSSGTWSVKTLIRMI